MVRGVFLIIILFVFNGVLLATNVNAIWVGCNWFDPNNWDPKIPPLDTSDDATISNGYFAPLVGAASVSLDSLSVNGSYGSSLILTDSALLQIESQSDLNVGVAGGNGTILVHDDAVLDVSQSILLGYGVNSFGCLDVSGGVVNTEMLAAGANTDSDAQIYIADGTINVGYRVYLGIAGGTETNPANSRLEISGGEIVFDPNSTQTEYFMVGYNSTGYSINTINQSGGKINVSYRLHLGDRGDNNICAYSISDGVLEVADNFANGYNWGDSYGTATSEFEIVGSKPMIHCGTYYQNSDSTLRAVIDENGISTIQVDGPAIFEADAKIEVALMDGLVLETDAICDILEAETITVEGKSVPKLIQTGDNYFCWAHEIVAVGNREVLRVTYRVGIDESFWWVTKGLALWLDASNTASVVSADGTLDDGDSISVWKDLIINDEYNAVSDDALQLTSIKQPIWRQSVSSLAGNSAIEFDGANTYLYIPTLEIDPNCTVFIVTECYPQTSTIGSIHRPLIAADNDPYRTSGNGYGFGFTWYGDNRFFVALGDDVTEQKQASSVLMDGQYRIYAFRREGDVLAETFERQYGDGSFIRLSNTPVLGRLLELNRGYDIGANPPEHSGNSARFYLGNIAEVLVFNQTLSDTEMDAISDYLYGKYF